MRFALLLLLSALAATYSAGAESTEPLALRNNSFALELYLKLSPSAGNLFLSPYSVSSAMAMVHEGARNDTEKEISMVFHFDPNSDSRRRSWAEAIRVLNAGDGTNILLSANALWAQKTYHFSPEYLGAVENYYGGVATNLDFVAESEKSRETINRWVEDHTKSKIRDLLPPGAVTDQTRLVLTNAVYFKGEWANQFDPAMTLDANFTTPSGTTVPARMMSMSGAEATFNYAKTDGVQAVEMPYKGRAISMILILPQDRNLPAFERRFNSQLFSKIRKALSLQEIVLQFPKFKVEAKYFMKQLLTGMGLATSFDPGKADFSGMTGKRELFISEVIHQSFVDVTEQGTEAAAATAVTMLAGSAFREPKPIPVFRADHPFLFLILDTRTGAILFMGRVTEPPAQT